MTTIRNTIVTSLILATSTLVLSGCDTRSDQTAANIVPAADHSTPQDTGSTPPAKGDAKKDAPAKAGDRGEVKPVPTEPPLKRPEPPAPPHKTAAPEVPVTGDPGAFLVKVEPSVLDMGQIPTGGSTTKVLRLINTAKEDMIVEYVRGTCGCTAVNFQNNTVLKPDEVREVEIRVSGGNAASKLQGKKVMVGVKGQPPMDVPLAGEIIAFVTVAPTTINLDTVSADATVTLASTDGTPFRILSMQPPVVTDFGNDAKTEHVVSVNWEAYKKSGVGRQMMFFLDHPKCSQAMAMVLQKPQPGVKGENFVTAPPPVVPVDPMAEVIQMINDGNTAAIMARVGSGAMTIEAADENGTTLLGLAARAGQVDIMNTLLSSGADLEAKDKVGRTPLMWAAQSKKPAAVTTLINAGADLHAKDNIGGTSMTWAAGLGDAATVQLLIDEGAEVEVVGLITGWTPLIWASGFGDANSIPILVKAGAEVEHGDFLQGATPLIHAIRTGSAEAVSALLAAGAKIEGKDNTGKTPFLAGAEASGCTAEKLKVLIDAGANIHAKDNRGLNGLQLARNRTDMRGPDMVALLEPMLAAETPTTTTAAAATPTAPAGSGGGVKQP